MRKTEANGWMRARLAKAAWFTAAALGIGLVVAAGPVRAADDEDEDDKTFEEKVIEGIMIAPSTARVVRSHPGRFFR